MSADRCGGYPSGDSTVLPTAAPTGPAPGAQHLPQQISTDDGHTIAIAVHVRIERRGNGKQRMFIDGQLFPWATSPDIEKVLTVKGVMTDVTLAIRAHTAEIVDVED